MRIRLTYIVLITGLMLLSCQKQHDGTVLGTVTEPTLLRPLCGVIVSVPKLSRSVRTDSTGHFQFEGIPLGEYILQFTDSVHILFSRPVYGFPSPRVSLTNDSLSRVNVLALPLFDEIQTYTNWRPYSIFRIKTGYQFFLGYDILDPSGTPLFPSRIILKDSVKRFISSLNEFRGKVTISSEKQARGFVNLLSSTNIIFEHNELGGRYFDVTPYNEKTTPFGLTEEECERLGLHKVRTEVETESTYLIERYLIRRDRIVFNLRERVSKTGAYSLLRIDSVGIARRLPLGLEL